MLAANPSGNYRYLTLDGRPFSAGVVADPGYDLVHATFARPIPLRAGLEAAARVLARARRPVNAIAGLELRSPSPLGKADFDSFNEEYVSGLRSLGMEMDRLVPAARTNVAASVGGVSEPSVYALTYTVSGDRARPAFVLSGAPEPHPGTPAEMLDAIVQVLSGRLKDLGAAWVDATAIQLYGVDNVQDLIVDRVLSRAGDAAVHGIKWFPSLPPIEGLRFEVDARSVGTEIFLTA